MTFPFSTLLIVVLVALSTTITAQKRAASPPTGSKTAMVKKSGEVGNTAVVIDETLSVLRASPSLFAKSVQRMRKGRRVQIVGVDEADGVKFYKVTAPPSNYGWVQADAVFGKFRPSDEERLARLVQALDGFEQIETAIEFFNLYPNSRFRPAILLLFGDLLEEVAAKLSKDANSKLKRAEMAASAAPLHSYFLNYVSLDRYRKLGVLFLFNSTTKQFHYDGVKWKEIVTKFSSSPEVAEAQKRLDALKAKMEKPAAK